MRYLVVIAFIFLAFYIGYKYSPSFYRRKNEGYCDNTSELKKQLRAEIIELDKQQPFTQGMKDRKDQLISMLQVFNNCKEFGPDYKCLKS